MPAEIKIELDDLEEGMYVSRLDRPWIETSFLLEGLLIKSDDDIETLKKLCQYVYIDTARGDSPQLNLTISDKSKLDNSPQQAHPVTVMDNSQPSIRKVNK